MLLVFASCMHEKEVNQKEEKSNSFRSSEPIQMETPSVSVEEGKVDTSEMQLVITTNSLSLNENGVKRNFSNLKEVDDHFEKIKDIKYQTILFVVSNKLDSLTSKELIRLIEKYQFQSLKFVSIKESN
ncbi:MAG: hypothetical protein RI922_945 [Bacteroidota bacterium]|jgi:hypothetical protein